MSRVVIKHGGSLRNTHEVKNPFRIHSQHYMKPLSIHKFTSNKWLGFSHPLPLYTTDLITYTSGSTQCYEACSVYLWFPSRLNTIRHLWRTQSTLQHCLQLTLIGVTLRIEFLATDREARVRFPALPEKSSGSETGSTQPREYNWGATW
jgi:hypothetical protein